jgi:hypothetical protein
MGIDTPHRTGQTEAARRTRPHAIHIALRAHGITSEVDGDVLTIEGDRPVALRCGPRDDGDRLWLYEPVAPADADHLHEAITWVKEHPAAGAKGCC